MIMDLLTALCVLVGAGFLLTSAIGLLRFPDVYCRGHALGLASTLGIGLLLLALWMQVGGFFNGFKIVLAVVLQFASIPIASHLIGLVALHKRMPRFVRGRLKQGDGSTAFPFSNP
jgi:multicomponent Na+:H+ antiporter subunit G